MAAAIGTGSAIAFRCSPLCMDTEAMRKGFCATQLVEQGIVPSAGSIAGEAGSEALAKAVRARDAQLALTLLRLGARPAAAGDSPLHYAAANGDGDILRCLLQYGADANQGDENGTTPLMLAAAAGHDYALFALLAAGADLDKRDNLGRTALMFAVQSAHAGTVSLLLQAGAEPNAEDPGKHTAIYYAIWADKPGNVRALVKGGAYFNYNDAEKRTPFMYAAEGRPECLKVLLAAPRLDLKEQDQYGKTAMDHAVFHQSVECAHLLKQALRREAGKELALRGIVAARYGDALLEAAATGDDKRLLLLLEAGAVPDFKGTLPDEAKTAGKKKGGKRRQAKAPAMGPGMTSLMAAAAHGQKHCLRLLLDAGADPTLRDESPSPQSALSYAAAGGHADCVRMLAKAPDPAWLKGEDGAQALLAAAMNGHKRCVKRLRKAGADPNMNAPCDAKREPILFLAVKANDKKATELLLAAGAVPTPDSALRAVLNHNPGILSMLVAAGADIHARDDYGRTPLILAANGCPAEQKVERPSLQTEGWRTTAGKHPHGDLACLNILLRAGAKVNARDRFGMTAAMYAAYQGHPHCLQQLLRHGADPSLANEDGETALELAQRDGKYYCIRILQATLPPAPAEPPAAPEPPAPAELGPNSTAPNAAPNPAPPAGPALQPQPIGQGAGQG